MAKKTAEKKKTESNKSRKKNPESRRTRSDSITAALDIAAMANREIVPPAQVRMRPDDLPFFDSVIAEFARAEWTDHALEIAALLARTMCDMEREQYELRDEGSVIPTEKGHLAVNPRKTVVQMCAGTILAMRRSLSLHARAHAGEARDVAKRREAGKQIENGVRKPETDDDDGLINRPATH